MRHVERLLTIEPGDPVVLLSFTKLTLEGGADRAQLERVVALTAGIANETPVDTALLLYRGRALARLGLPDAAMYGRLPRGKGVVWLRHVVGRGHVYGV